MQMDNLEKVDIVRNRMNVSYEGAREVLEANKWDIVEALVHLEKHEEGKKERFFVKGNDLVDKLKEVLRQGNVNRILVKQDEKVLVEIPVTAGVVGAMLAPQLAIVGAVAALVSKCSVEIERDNGSSVNEKVNH